MGELALEVQRRILRTVGPPDERDIRDAVPPARDVPLILRAREVRIQDPVQTLRLAHVPLYAPGDFFFRGAQEVVRLPLHGPHAAVLPADPAVGAGVVVAVDGEREFVFGIVLAREVRQDGAAFEDGEVVVIVVHDGGDPAVGVDGGEPWFLLGVGADVDGLGGVGEAVGVLELFEEDGGFPAVGGCFRDVSAIVIRDRWDREGSLHHVKSSMPLSAMGPVGWPWVIVLE